MKKIFTLLAIALLSIATYAQDVQLTELWNHSRSSTATEVAPGVWEDGVPPSWMTASAWSPTERGMVVVGDKVYVPSRKDGGQIILVIDAATGDSLTKIDLPLDPVSGGIYSINAVAATASGDLVVSNLVTNSQGVDSVGNHLPSSYFKAYHVELDAEGTNYDTITNIISWNNVADTATQPFFRIGDGMCFCGDIADGSSGYLATVSSTAGFILTWKVTDGTFEANPTIYQPATANPAPEEGSPVNFGTSPMCTPVSENLLIVDGGNLYPAVYDLASPDSTAIEMLTTFGDSIKPRKPNGNGVDYFEFKGRQFIAAQTNVWLDVEGVPVNSFEVFELVDGDWEQAVSLGFVPENGLSRTTAMKNASFANPVSVDVQEDKAVIYVMSGNLGIAAYELTIGGGTDIPGLIGLYTFEDTEDLFANYATEVGVGTVKCDGVMKFDPDATDTSADDKPSTEDTDWSVITGASDNAIALKAHNWFKLWHGIPKNGGGDWVNDFTITVDVRLADVTGIYSMLEVNPTPTESGFTSEMEIVDGTVGTTGAPASGADAFGFSDVVISNDTWHRVTYVAKLSESIKMYVDGVLVRSMEGDFTDARPAPYTADDHPDDAALRVGGNNETIDNNDPPRDGDKDIDQIMIFNRTLSGSEVEELGAPVATGIEDRFVEEREVTVYPNPASDVLYFSKEMQTVKVFDISGRLVKQAINVSRINVNDLSGLYIVNGMDREGNVTHTKVLVK
ncbi:MAG: T9SS type A sorting domain-containing protein [Bacteroidota bacterium]